MTYGIILLVHNAFLDTRPLRPKLLEFNWMSPCHFPLTSSGLGTAMQRILKINNYLVIIRNRIECLPGLAVTKVTAIISKEILIPQRLSILDINWKYLIFNSSLGWMLISKCCQRHLCAKFYTKTLSRLYDPAAAA